MENENKRLFEWLNPDGCWRKKGKWIPDENFPTTRSVAVCAACEIYHLNPDYSTESGFFALLAGLTKRKDEEILPERWLKIEFSGAIEKWTVQIGNYVQPYQFANKVIASADTLPQALHLAALKVLEAETQ